MAERNDSARQGAADAKPCFALLQTNCSVLFIPVGSNDKPAKPTSKQVGSRLSFEN
jgi:hypothetical protein